MSAEVSILVAPEHAPATPDAAVRITSESLQAMQWWAALVTVSVPTIGAMVAAFLAFRTRIGVDVLVAWALMHMATMVGITVGFHRLGAHRAFQTSPRPRAVLLVLGSMAAQGPVVHWVSNHRRHHHFSDQEGDVHSPHLVGPSWRGRVRGFWHAHLGWMFSGEVTNPMRYSKDLLRDKALMKINRLYLVWVFVGLVAPAVALGAIERSWRAALAGFLWAGLVRVFTVHHATWSVNSITHLWGTRPFRSLDRSVNVAWLAIPTAGEAWHNCHHAFPSSARFGLAWWQFDVGYVVIWTLERFGLAFEVNRPSPGAMARMRTNTSTAVDH